MINALVILSSGAMWLWVVLKKDLYEKEPLFKLLKIALLGGIISIIPAGFLNSVMSYVMAFDISKPASLQNRFAYFAFVGVNEEFWKAFATVYLIARHKDFNEPVDGMIYAMTVALGFAVIENVQYIALHGLGVLVGRHFVSMPAHIAFAMCWGYGLALAKFKFPERRASRVMLPYGLFAASLHGLFDVLATAGTTPAIVAGFILVLALFLYGNKNTNRLLLLSPFRPDGHCTQCQTQNPITANFCQHCGADMRKSQHLIASGTGYFERKVCRQCRTSNIPGAQFCKQCGTTL